ncbi:hepatic lectin-like [Diadema setosum]|uniref:hepatic lectin-like n=1 Tax=Diadema setosum TaxID=31175 RepID=UPI003B3AEE88
MNNTESGSCYKLVKTEKTYSAAKTTCEQENAHVVSLNTEEELSFVYQYVSNEVNPFKTFWIGLTRVSGGWLWEDGTSLNISSSTFWADGEPNNAGNQENNAQMNIGSKVNDIHGSRSFYFVCEKK